MAAPMIKTRHPGIYKRGGRYVVRYRAGGRHRNESARTLDEALRIKRQRQTDSDRGEFQERSRVTLHEYAREWVERYQGRGRHGFRENTRDDYRRLLERYALRHFPERLRLVEVTPRHVAQFIAWLCDEREQGKRLSDSTVRNVLNPLRACLATAVQEGLVRHNPTQGCSLPHRPTGDEPDAEEVRVFTREQAAAFLRIVHPRYRVLFRLLAATGLRWSEVAALQWRHLRLDGSAPCVQVRRALVRGKFGPPKSRHGRRDVPLDAAVVAELRDHHADSARGGVDDLVFSTRSGNPLHYSNVLRRNMKPVAEEVGAPAAGFHTFRHTFASLHIARGTNVLQLSRLLGHHSAAFTLEVYGHLMDGDHGSPLDLSLELAEPAAEEVNPGSRGVLVAA